MHNMARCKLMGTCLWSCFGDFGRKSRLGSGILKRVCGYSLRIREAVCRYQPERVCWGKHRQFGWYNDVLKRVCGSFLRIHSAVCEYQFGRVCWGKRRQLSWYDVLERVCWGLLRIRSAVCRCRLKCISKLERCQRLWLHKVVPKFSSGWT